MTVTKVKTEAEFDSFLAKSREAGTIVVVDFSAAWCGPCRMMEPRYEAMSSEYPSITFLKVDVDEVASVAQKCGITAMPTFHVYKAGEKIGEVVGANEAALKKLVEDNS